MFDSCSWDLKPLEGKERVSFNLEAEVKRSSRKYFRRGVA